MSSDALYGSCIDETLKYLRLYDFPLYFYHFEFEGSRSMVNILMNSQRLLYRTGVCHGDELFYLFHPVSGSRELAMEDRMTTLWTDFAKHG